ncbi:peptidoglycan-binding protein [Gracilibacillus lacisalsi]|uniref:peptidoglycan-binding protein n=1 Tax=Gracilibacillus lacisalsi TaxID=393087 RepID=UPI0003682B05|nr:peptidoglycan-binding protein [Gracilibacillus lacisalsi]
MKVIKNSSFVFLITLVVLMLSFSPVQAQSKDGQELEKNVPEEITDHDKALANQTLENSDVLKKGTSHPGVVDLKQNLERLGFGSFEMTEDYDSQTEQAVKDFQSYHGLEENGQGDQTTLEKIEELLSSPFQNGQRHEETVRLKENLYILGYWDSPSGTTLYASKTEKAVKEFQQDQALPQSGIADDVTRAKLSELAQQPLRNGMYRKDAVTLKEDLEHLGFGSFAKTDYFGPQTEQTVKNFQSYYGLEESGQAGQATLEKMEELLSSPFQNGKRHEETVTLKENLYTLGYWDSPSGTTLYASKTEKAVQKFQKDHDLPQSGIADAATREKISELAKQPLQNGMYRKDAVTLKEGLERLGFGSFAKTDYFGPQTEQTVKNFQSYYGLEESGQADQATLEKMEELLSSPFQNGQRHEETVTLKANLYILGYWDSTSGTTLYGSKTEKAVKEFQKDHGLSQSGIADAATREKINELAEKPLQNGMYRKDAVTLKEDLERLGFGSFAKTDYFGPQTEKTVKNFQSYYGLNVNGRADQSTLNKMEELLSSPFQNGQRHKETVTLKENLYTLGYWDSPSGTTLYASKTEKAVKEFQKDQGLPQSGIADDATLEKISELAQQPLQNGMYRKDAVTLKEDLERLGFGSFKKTDYFGPQTEREVKKLQRYYGLNATGIADNQTLRKINDVLSSPLQDRNNHPDVVTLKEDLRHLGFWNRTKLTDLFAGETEKAVRAFQEHYGLAVNGIADEPTLAKIESILKSPYQNGNSNSDISTFKEQLIFLGYSQGISTTQLFGPKTEARVKDFQQDMNLPVSGILDEVTIEVLEHTYSNHAVKIFIDPGHGGNDPGGNGYGLKEKDVVLKIAKSAQEYLQKNYEGVDVKLSRSTDVFVGLETRSQIANDWNADYFVSFHTNAFNGSANGFESYIYNGNVSKETERLQKEIHTFIIDEIGAYDRGMKQANFNVLRNTNMPALLLEYLFIDNKNDNELLSNESYVKRLGEVTAKAIAESFYLRSK